MTAPCYLHRTPRWKLASVLAPALCLVLAAFVYLAYRLYLRGLDGAEIAFGLFLLPFLFLLLRPSSWRPPVALAADRNGLHFVGSDESLFVPWHETGPFSIEQVRMSAGVGQSVVATIATGSTFWDEARRSRFAALLLGTEKPPGFLRIALGNQGIEPELTRASLEALRLSSGYEDAWAGYVPGPQARSWHVVVAGAFMLCLAALFGAFMLRSMLRDDAAVGFGLVVPLAMALLSLLVIRHGLRRRH